MEVLYTSVLKMKLQFSEMEEMIWVFNPFHGIGFCLNPLKTLKNLKNYWYEMG